MPFLDVIPEPDQEIPASKQTYVDSNPQRIDQDASGDRFAILGHDTL